MGMFRSPKKESVRKGKSEEENVDDCEDGDEGDKMPLWEDTDDDGIDATWRTVERERAALPR